MMQKSESSTPRVVFGVVALAVAFSVVPLGICEVALRMHGFTPTYVDDMALWALHRERVYKPNTICLVGSSRIQTGIDPGLLSELCNGANVVQLAINGRGPVAVLRDLARDQKFQGTMLVEFAPASLMDSADGQPWVEYARSGLTVHKRVEKVLMNELQSRLVVLDPRLKPRGIVYYWLLQEHQLPGPFYSTVRKDRMVSADYEKAHDINTMVERWRAPYRAHSKDSIVEKWTAGLRTVASAVHSIQLRGGTVFFVKFPTTGVLDSLIEKAYAWQEYVPDMKAALPGIVYHYRDLDSTAVYNCPDEAHLGLSDAHKFTRVVGALLGQTL